MQIPRMMIAAAGSGSGKTTITCALLKNLSEHDKNISAYKCGPDYIDPMFHQKVLGVPSKNLDPYFTGESRTRELFMADASCSKFSVVEGVMGLYDGLGGIGEEASSYHLAKILDLPVILVINAHGMGRSLLPLIAGFLSFDTEHLIKGVILNRISQAFYERIRPEIEANLPIRVFGFFPDTKEIRIKSRHLGLKLPEEIADIKEKIRKAAQILSTCIEIPQLLQIAEQAPDMYEIHTMDAFLSNRPFGKKKIPLGVAMDETFCFYYRDNLKLLEQMGAEIVPFSPLHDTALPKGIRGILFGGGYPELYAEELSNNESMRKSVVSAIHQGMPSIAECGGFLYLHNKMQQEDGAYYDMAGVWDGICFDTGKLVRFGYVEIQERTPRFLNEKSGIKGHEFHYFDSTNNGQDCLAVKPITGRTYSCVYNARDSWWGFVHLYYYSNPQYVSYFIERMTAFETAAP